ncbi:hypothetical protein [Rubritalea tangerina]|uniref:Uncharacterized protein n=1 Tax=Rubritalea tangerina TaxID=430798 RepID=A0ABW4Z911_9BACT
MLRNIITVVLCIASYFGAIFLLESRHPEVKQLSSRTEVIGTKLHASGLPDQLLGTFNIQHELSRKWLNSQQDLDDETKGYFASLQASQSQFTFDGQSIWFVDHIANIPVKVLKQENYMLELEMLESSAEHKGSLTFFLQWDDQGNVWYSNYSHLQGGEKKIYRACYRKSVPVE